MKISDFRKDERKELDGVWVDYAEGLRLLVARFNNPHYQKIYEQQSKPHLRKLRKNPTGDISKRISRQAMAKSVLLGWEGLEDDDGKTVVYSPEKALEYLEVPDFYQAVLEISLDEQLYAIELQREAEKNSQSASTGISDMEESTRRLSGSGSKGPAKTASSAPTSS